jgi:hypothetical protein
MRNKLLCHKQRPPLRFCSFCNVVPAFSEAGKSSGGFSIDAETDINLPGLEILDGTYAIPPNPRPGGKIGKRL